MPLTRIEMMPLLIRYKHNLQQLLCIKAKTKLKLAKMAAKAFLNTLTESFLNPCLSPRLYASHEISFKNVQACLLNYARRYEQNIVQASKEG
jgi:hypothetical protein